MAGVFSDKIFRTFWPPGAIQNKKQKKSYASDTHPATTLKEQEALLMSQSNSTEKAPGTDKKTQTTITILGEACVVPVKRRT